MIGSDRRHLIKGASSSRSSAETRGGHRNITVTVQRPLWPHTHPRDSSPRNGARRRRCLLANPVAPVLAEIYVTMNLAEQLAQGVQASQRGAWDAAVTYLEPVFADQQLAQAEEMADIEPASHLYAQALLEAGRPREADTVCREALRALRRLKDRVG